MGSTVSRELHVVCCEKAFLVEVSSSVMLSLWLGFIYPLFFGVE